LTLSALKPQTRKEEGGFYHQMERHFGRFFRRVLLPYHVDVESIKAHMDCGVLKVSPLVVSSIVPSRILIDQKTGALEHQSGWQGQNRGAGPSSPNQYVHLHASLLVFMNSMPHIRRNNDGRAGVRAAASRPQGFVLFLLPTAEPSRFQVFSPFGTGKTNKMRFSSSIFSSASTTQMEGQEAEVEVQTTVGTKETLPIRCSCSQKHKKMTNTETEAEVPIEAPKLEAKNVIYCGGTLVLGRFGHGIISIFESIYYPVCGLPAEYCEFGPDFNRCKPWLIANCPEVYPELIPKEGEEKKGMCYTTGVG
jgi:hypothetical protein